MTSAAEALTYAGGLLVLLGTLVAVSSLLGRNTEYRDELEALGVIIVGSGGVLAFLDPSLSFGEDHPGLAIVCLIGIALLAALFWFKRTSHWIGRKLSVPLRKNRNS